MDARSSQLNLRFRSLWKDWNISSSSTFLRQASRMSPAAHRNGTVDIFLFLCLSAAWSSHLPTCACTCSNICRSIDWCSYLLFRCQTCALPWPVQQWTPLQSFMLSWGEPWLLGQRGQAVPCCRSWHRRPMPSFTSRLTLPWIHWWRALDST